MIAPEKRTITPIRASGRHMNEAMVCIAVMRTAGKALIRSCTRLSKAGEKVS